MSSETVFLLTLVVGFQRIMAFEAAIMTADMTPDNGPEMDTVYQSGTSGGDWNEEEIESTRRRIMKIMTPIWEEKFELGTATTRLGKTQDETGQVTENVILQQQGPCIQVQSTQCN